ncbi:MAG: flavin reductase [Bacteroidia bacterium]
MQLNHQSILELDERYRRNLINSIHGAKTIALIGSKSKDGVSNLAIFSQIIHIGANPPVLGVLFRPDSVNRHTLDNIRDSGHFTYQNVKSEFYKQAHQTSARYPDNISEFNECGLSEEYLSNFPIPFVKESTVKVGLSLADEIPIKINGTHLILGKVELLEIDDSYISSDGFVDPFLAETIAGGGLDAYYSLNKLSRLSYAKPGKPLEDI